MTQYLITPAELIQRAMNVEGFRDLYLYEVVQPSVIHSAAIDVATEWTNDWEEGEGFGSSDAHYMLRHFIQEVLEYGGVGHKYQLSFPKLAVVEYSEASEDARELEMEIGG